MASSFKPEPGYRRSDPDETEGRLLYRQIAERDARRSMALARSVRLLPVQPTIGASPAIANLHRLADPNNGLSNPADTQP